MSKPKTVRTSKTVKTVEETEQNIDALPNPSHEDQQETDYTPEQLAKRQAYESARSLSQADWRRLQIERFQLDKGLPFSVDPVDGALELDAEAYLPKGKYRLNPSAHVQCPIPANMDNDGFWPFVTFCRNHPELVFVELPHRVLAIARQPLPGDYVKMETDGSYVLTDYLLMIK